MKLNTTLTEQVHSDQKSLALLVAKLARHLRQAKSITVHGDVAEMIPYDQEQLTQIANRATEIANG